MRASSDCKASSYEPTGLFHPARPGNVGLNVGVNVGVTDQILVLLAQEPRLSAKEMASLLNKTPRTIERHLKLLREQGRIQRVGSDKAGHWKIIERPAGATPAL
jgi:ATP-dependent DNA helicase RecG